MWNFFSQLGLKLFRQDQNVHKSGVNNSYFWKIGLEFQKPKRSVSRVDSNIWLWKISKTGKFLTRMDLIWIFKLLD